MSYETQAPPALLQREPWLNFRLWFRWRQFTPARFRYTKRDAYNKEYGNDDRDDSRVVDKKSRNAFMPNDYAHQAA